MRSLTRNQFLKIFGISSGAFDALQRAGHVALAFGTPIPATPGRYLDLDLMAMAIADALAPTVGRPAATTIVLGFFNQWVAAVGQADADTTQNYFFAMGLVGQADDERRPREIWVTNGTIGQIMADLGNASSVMAINITDTIARLRAKARAAGIDLSQPFFFPPEHERYSQIITEFKQEREARTALAARQKQIMATGSSDATSEDQVSCKSEKYSHSVSKKHFEKQLLHLTSANAIILIREGAASCHYGD